LSFKNRHREVVTPGNYTELFFHDEAVAFAAGHRPCGECRRTDYSRFRAAAGIDGKIADFDARLHADRAVPRVWQQRRHLADVGRLPSGVFILDETERPALIWQETLRPFSPSGYGNPVRRPTSGQVTVLTPKILVASLRAGYMLDVRLEI
jgi:hypothetical protein